RNRGAVDFDKRGISTRAQPVNGATHQLFTGSAWTRNQHRRSGRSHLVDVVVQLLHRVARARHLVSTLELVSHLIDGAPQSRRTNAVLYADQYPFPIERLLEKVG